jgi:hypothetical protein
MSDGSRSENPAIRMADYLASLWLSARDAIESWGSGYPEATGDEPRRVRYTSLLADGASLSGRLLGLWVQGAWVMTRDLTSVAADATRAVLRDRSGTGCPATGSSGADRSSGASRETVADRPS